jgi:AAA domain
MESNSKPADRTRYAKMTKEERLQSFKGVTIAHPHLQEADKALREMIQEPGGASIVNVYGPARVGKSTMMNHVIRTLLLEWLPLLERDRERVPLLSIVPRPPLDGSFSWRNFFQIGLIAFDEPLIERKIALEREDDDEQMGVVRLDASRIKRKPPEGTKDALRQSFEAAAIHRRPVAIFIDEAQHVGIVSNARQLKIQLECIKSLAESTGALMVLIGTYDLLPLRALSAQLIGRSLDIHFPRYRGTTKELLQFKNVLRTFQEALPFVEETDILLKHWEFCYERSIGCVGNLRLMLVRALRAALWANVKTLSWKHLKANAISEAESFGMMREAYKGEEELASKPGQRAQLRKMLGLDSGITSKTAPQTEEPASGGKTTQQGQVDETTKGDEQELPPKEAPAGEALSELQPVSGGDSNETSNGSEEENSAEETLAAQTSPRPLKEPKAETPRPFRRKQTRDPTGGPRQKKKD